MNERRNRVIAIVDDDDSVRRSIRNLLLSLNYRVATFPSAEAFLLSSSPGDTGCVILDLRMSGMGGLGLLKVQATAQRQVPVIVLTAHGSDEARTECLRFGAIAFFQKPCDTAELCATVKAAMEMRP
jgi:two-component system response regulator FixJ